MKWSFQLVFTLHLHFSFQVEHHNGTEGDFFEGDITGMPYNMFKRNSTDEYDAAITFQHRLWQTRRIPYMIAGFASIEEQFIEYAMVEIHLSSCVKFIHRTNEHNYVLIQKDGLRRCHSTLGFLNKGVQIVGLHSICMSRNTILHELMHVLGFYHEHTRYDRDDYVSVNHDNIKDDFKHNFAKRDKLNITHLETKYDFNSVMHYLPNYGSKNGWPTIEPIEQGVIIQADGLSKSDVERINKLYKCPASINAYGRWCNRRTENEENVSSLQESTNSNPPRRFESNHATPQMITHRTSTYTPAPMESSVAGQLMSWKLINNLSKTEIEKSTKIQYLHIKSQIQSRFAITLITSEVINLACVSQEIFFSAQLPDDAFISNFSIKINDKVINGDVKEKEKAKNDYQKAVREGKSTGLVAEKPRETNNFEISVNIAANGKISFNLTYQKMLKRTHGVYKHVINLQPQQEVDDLQVEVFINEQGELKNLKVPKFSPKAGEKTNRDLLKPEVKNEKNVKIEATNTRTNSYAYITFKPTDKTNGALSGQLVVLYDVVRDNTGGHIEVMNGYFVHFFAPTGLVRGKKNVVFVLDKSGSMSGRKFKQTKDAMKLILKDLDKYDKFNILMFSDETEQWKPKSVQATEDNVKIAVQHIQQQKAMGGTNIHDALSKALTVLSSNKGDSLTSMIIFLTDGEATVGEMNNDVIVNSITSLNEQQNFVIHSLAFGNDADFKLVQRISSRNKGLARKVYEDSDADLQLIGFFGEISSPLLTNVDIKYLNETVDVESLVQDNSYNYYDGGEFVVVGKLKENVPTNPFFGAAISAGSQSGVVQFRAESRDILCPKEFVIIEGDIMVPCCTRPHCPVDPIIPRPVFIKPLLPASSIGGFIERMWAYQTIKKLLKSSNLESDNKEKDRQKALELSLKYKFVTELTSMVVIQSDQANGMMASRTLLEDVDYQDLSLNGPPPPSHGPTHQASIPCSGVGEVMIFVDSTVNQELLSANNRFVKSFIKSSISDMTPTMFNNTFESTNDFNRSCILLYLTNNSLTEMSIKVGYGNITEDAKNTDAVVIVIGDSPQTTLVPTIEHFERKGKKMFVVNFSKDTTIQASWKKLVKNEFYINSPQGYTEISNRLRCST